MHGNVLYLRLHNCLQTVLELERSVSAEALSDCGELKELFSTLKDSIDQLDRIDYGPDDVARIEHSVSIFLQAIKPSLHNSDKKLYSGRILQ